MYTALGAYCELRGAGGDRHRPEVGHAEQPADQHDPQGAAASGRTSLAIRGLRGKSLSESEPRQQEPDLGR